MQQQWDARSYISARLHASHLSWCREKVARVLGGRKKGKKLTKGPKEGPKEGKRGKKGKNTEQKKKEIYWLSIRMIGDISSRIKVISDNLPFDFNRNLRPLKEYSRWKATECRSFLLYIHFMQLSVACRILMSPSLQNKLSAAHILLQKFVTNFGIPSRA